MFILLISKSKILLLVWIVEEIERVENGYIVVIGYVGSNEETIIRMYEIVISLSILLIDVDGLDKIVQGLGIIFLRIVCYCYL